jgi:hypothetical protein
MKQPFISSLTLEQQQILKDHINTIYECKELTEHEYNIAYLAWLWAQGRVYYDDNFSLEFDEKEAGISMEAFEITFEDDYRLGGTNLQITYDYYCLDQLIGKMKW